MERQSKELEEALKSTDEGVSIAPQLPTETAGKNLEEKPDVDKPKPEENWKDGYTEYEIKPKKDSQMSYDDTEIEVTEE